MDSEVQPDAGTPALRLTDITMSFGSNQVLKGVTMALAPGTVTALLGANGAGKSTTLRMLLGLTRPTSGRALVNGVPYAELPTPAREVGALTDPDVFHPRRSGRNALRVLAAASGVPDRRVDEVLALVDLTTAASRRVGGYSLGMRQRLGLAAALLGDPAVLVLDEPANGLDPLGVHWLRGLLRRFGDEGRTVLVSSHQLAELAQTVDDVIVIDRGRLVARGQLSSLTGDRDRSLEDLFFDLISTGSEGRPS
jgi:ABC-2 type transport system ATP-binding protein